MKNRKESGVVRFLIAILLTLLPTASAFGETWTPVGTTVQPETKTSLALVFEIEEIRGYSSGCSMLACQVVLPQAWQNRERYAKRWYQQCVEAIETAHEATHDWNPRDIKKTGEASWLVTPETSEEPAGARYLCYKQVRKPKPRAVLPDVSVAPVEGPRAETFDTRVGRAEPPPSRAETPRIEVPPAPKARPLIEVAEPPPAAKTEVKPVETELRARQQTWRLVAAGCYSLRADTGFHELEHAGCARAGLEFHYRGLLLSAALDVAFGGSETLLGGRGSFGYEIGPFEIGAYGRYLGGVSDASGLPTATLRDLGPYVALTVFDNEVVGLVLVLDISIGSRLIRSETSRVTESSTLGIPAGQLALAFRFAPF